MPTLFAALTKEPVPTDGAKLFYDLLLGDSPVYPRMLPFLVDLLNAPLPSAGSRLILRRLKTRLMSDTLAQYARRGPLTLEHLEVEAKKVLELELPTSALAGHSAWWELGDLNLSDEAAYQKVIDAGVTDVTRETVCRLRALNLPWSWHGAVRGLWVHQAYSFLEANVSRLLRISSDDPVQAAESIAMASAFPGRQRSSRPRCGRSRAGRCIACDLRADLARTPSTTGCGRGRAGARRPAPDRRRREAVDRATDQPGVPRIAEVFAAGAKTSVASRRVLAKIAPGWEREPCPFADDRGWTLKAVNETLYPPRRA